MCVEFASKYGVVTTNEVATTAISTLWNARRTHAKQSSRPALNISTLRHCTGTGVFAPRRRKASITSM
jgi:ureidoglycolate hydrolase